MSIFKKPPAHFHLTGKGLRARWQRWRLRRAYARPVTFADLRHIAYDAAHAEGHPAGPPTPAGRLLDAVCRNAEEPVFKSRRGAGRTKGRDH